MTQAQKLTNLLKIEIIPDLEIAMDEIFENIDDTKKVTEEDKEHLEEMHEMRQECFSILDELRKNLLDDEEIEDLLSELIDIKTEDL